MKIVILDGTLLDAGDLDFSIVKSIGPVVVYDETTTPQEAIERIGDAEYVFTTKAPITAEVMDNTQIKWIGTLSTGDNMIDLEYAREVGILVCHVPNVGNYAIGQLALALLLELTNHVGKHSHRVMHENAWQTEGTLGFWNSSAMELSGKTMGIIGFGKNGQVIGSIAKALGMKVIAYDKIKNRDLMNQGYEYVSMDELFEQSDVISLHCPLKDDNYHIICKENIDKMKDGVLILNTSRGELINEQDLADALNSGKVAGAGLDVLTVEPVQEDNPLLIANNCIITPHIAWAPRETRQRLVDVAANNLKEFLNGNTVNAAN
ncbi:MAG: glycerate dehydrogenase [Epulopiscium sp. Nuni2H_MBin003]|nr:MAG: glycerate dehydrogenase [Epulopiscium sp. Nuni2H_MBin003]